MTRRSGRPLGAIARQTLQFASERGVTALDVARELKLSRGHASDTIYKLKSLGHMVEVDRRQVDGARKPVPVVRAVTPAAPPDPVTIGILSLDWPR
jgi:predicted transcriptional regulator